MRCLQFHLQLLRYRGLVEQRHTAALAARFLEDLHVSGSGLQEPLAMLASGFDGVHQLLSPQHLGKYTVHTIPPPTHGPFKSSRPNGGATETLLDTFTRTICNRSNGFYRDIVACNMRNNHLAANTTGTRQINAHCAAHAYLTKAAESLPLPTVPRVGGGAAARSVWLPVAHTSTQAASASLVGRRVY